MNRKGKLIFAATILIPPALLWAILWAVGWLPFDSSYATLAMIFGGYAAWAAFLSYVAKYGEFLRATFPAAAHAQPTPPPSQPLVTVTGPQASIDRTAIAGRDVVQTTIEHITIEATTPITPTPFNLPPDLPAASPDANHFRAWGRPSPGRAGHRFRSLDLEIALRETGEN
jgi:hypothetical protein